jgi:putative DNA primase/helicase
MMQKDSAYYVTLGWRVFPAPCGTKRSHKSAEHSKGAKWGATTDVDQIKQDWAKWPNANVGIVTGPESGIWVLDADTLDAHGADGVGRLEGWEREHGKIPDTVLAKTPSGGLHYYFRYPVGTEIRTSAGKVALGVDIRGAGGIVLAPPSVKPDGNAYRWLHPPVMYEVKDCPKWLLQKVLASQASKNAVTGPRPIFASGTDEVHALLSHIPADCGYENWLTVLMALHDRFGGSPEGCNIADQWSAQGASYSPGEVQTKWKSFTHDGGIRWEAIPALARSYGADLRVIALKYNIKGSQTYVAASDVDEDVPQPPVFTELLEKANALTPGDVDAVEELVGQASSQNPVRLGVILTAIKTSAGVSITAMREMIKNANEAEGKGIEPDHLVLATRVIHHIEPENIICEHHCAWRWSPTGVWVKMEDRALKQVVQHVISGDVSVNATKVAGVVDVLKTEIFRPDHFFNIGNPETVNCLNGELELECGRWRLTPHCREHYRTTQIPVVFDPTAQAPIFQAFLDQIFRDDDDKAEKKSAVLELIGYTLMSHARQEIFVMLIGAGANGKSVLLAVLEKLIGTNNVAAVQPTNFDRSFQRAHLHEKLANIVTELKQGEVIADAELKAITSGEPATVEHKFQPPFVMRPYATCWFGTNHMPHTRDFSDALFRRATIITFNRVFQKSEQNPILKDELAKELPGILNLSLSAYAGALKTCFTQPSSSVAATTEWKLEADQVAQFVVDCCEVGGGEEPVGYLFDRYIDWTHENGIKKLVTQKTFRDRLTRLNFGDRRTGKVRYVTGLKFTR